MQRVLKISLLAALVALCLPSLAQAAPTYVSLTFDDASADQMAALPILQAHGMKGTFYVNSGRVNDPDDDYFMTWNQVHQVANAGNEIAGHSAHHSDLTTLTAAQQQTEICGDRQALIAQGFNPTNFAYPYAAWNASVRNTVQSCGYATARGVGNVGCSGCASAESLPPTDPYVLRTTSGNETGTTLAQMQGWVTNAETHGGGWVIVVLHNICDGCNENSTSAAKLSSFLDWLQPRQASGTQVKTVQDVVSTPPPPPPTNLLQNSGLESLASDGSGPTCWTRGSYAGASGAGNTGTITDTADAHGGTHAEKLQITSYGDGDQKLVSTQDPTVVTPTLVSAAASSSGGTLSAGTYYYKVTATNAAGETLASNELAATTTGSTSSVALEWSAKSGATGYKIYRATTSGNETLLASVGPGDLEKWTDTGANATSSAQPPSANTATKNSSCSPDAAAPGQVYQLNAWYKTQGTTLTRPTIKASSSLTGGTLPRFRTYYYKLTATVTGGETLPSKEVVAITLTNQSSIKISWPAVPGATGYKLYRSGSPGRETLLTTLGNVTSYTDTGSITPGTTLPPSVDTGSTVPVPRFIYYYRDNTGNWVFWREQLVPASNAWTPLVSQSPALPSGATKVGVGASIMSQGTLTVDDVTLGALN